MSLFSTGVGCSLQPLIVRGFYQLSSRTERVRSQSNTLSVQTYSYRSPVRGGSTQSKCGGPPTENDPVNHAH